MQRPQKKSKPVDKFEINEKIRAREVRVIDEENQMLGIYKIADALHLREERGLDLVNISASANPPVCKIIDYGKFLYQQEKKRKEVKKHQKNVQLKEIKMRPKTDIHDYEFKIRHAKEFLSKGNKVKITIKFKGREMSFINLGNDMINRIIEDTKNDARIEVPSKLEGRNLHMVLGPRNQTNTATTAVKSDKKAAESE